MDLRYRILVIGLGLAIVVGPMACQPRKETRELSIEEITRVGDLIYAQEETTPYDGWVVDHYEEGALRSRALYQEGTLNGLSEGWFASGALEIRETFVDGVSQGEKTRYYENGQLRSQGTVVNGEYDGLYRQWNEEGVLTESVALTNGVPHGVSQAWHSNGKVKSVVRMEAGVALESEFYDEEGTRIIE